MPEKSTIEVDSRVTPTIEVPEPMVMSRAGSSLGSFSSINSNNSANLSNGKLPSHISGNNNDVTVSNPQRRRPHEDSTLSSSGGILSGPLAWVQKNRERRRRLQLQHEAEEQLRKIAEAEGMTRHSHENHHPLPPLIPTSGGNGGSHDSGDENYKIGTHQHLSKSGEGMTAELDFVEDEDEFMIPPVRIHPEVRRMRTQQMEEGAMDDSPRKSEFKEPEYLLSPEQMHQIAIHVLPKTISYCQWRRLYSLSRDGDSFDGCLRLISSVARTLMVVRTTKGAIFGGYADSPWKPMDFANARFYGSALACLFSVKDPATPIDQVKKPKSLLKVYHWSGKNRYIQLCDTSSKMLAFGGGGSDGAFGLCLQEDFQTGSTGPCDTFDNDPLCDESTFEVVDVEIWEFLTGLF